MKWGGLEVDRELWQTATIQILLTHRYRPTNAAVSIEHC